MSIRLLAFALFSVTFVFGFSEEKIESFQILKGGIVEEFISPPINEELKKTEIVETPQFQEEVFVPETEVAKMASELQEEVFEPETEVAEIDSELENEHLFEIEFEAASEPVVGPYKASCFEEEVPEEVCVDYCFDSDPYCDPQKKWYFEIKPGYFYFSDNDMRRFFNDGGFTFRAETGCRFYDYMIVWVDGSYFEKTGRAIGGSERLKIKLATITLGLKGIYYFNQYAAIYGGLGPRLFMMLLDNASPFVRGDDNEIGIGGGFNAGFWFFPVPRWENFFIDVFVDYSLKELKIDADEISSFSNDVDVSGLTGGIGIGVRF